jgi:hypothetical protein
MKPPIANQEHTYTVPSGAVGWQKKRWKPFSAQNNLILDSEGNEENVYPVPESNKTKINYAKEPKEAQKNILKEENLQVITENIMEMFLDMVNQNIWQALKKFEDTKNKE